MSQRPKLRKAIVAAPGPSLQSVADCVNKTDWPVIAVQDAYRIVDADILYGCDAKWWMHHEGCPDFKGQKWASHNHRDHADDKRKVAELYDLNLISGKAGDGYSTDPDVIHYGDNSGFQAINLAIAFGVTYIVLVGYDMRFVGGKSHFFGDHPQGLYQRGEYGSFIKKFTEPPDGVTIINATPESALEIYPIMELSEALKLHEKLKCPECGDIMDERSMYLLSTGKRTCPSCICDIMNKRSDRSVWAEGPGCK